MRRREPLCARASWWQTAIAVMAATAATALCERDARASHVFYDAPAGAAKRARAYSHARARARVLRTRSPLRLSGGGGGGSLASLGDGDGGGSGGGSDQRARLARCTLEQAVAPSADHRRRRLSTSSGVAAVFTRVACSWACGRVARRGAVATAAAAISPPAARRCCGCGLSRGGRVVRFVVAAGGGTRARAFDVSPLESVRGARPLPRTARGESPRATLPPAPVTTRTTRERARARARRASSQSAR